MTVSVVENLWWPFGAHLLHTKYAYIHAQSQGFAFFYRRNTAQVFLGGTIEHYFENPSTIESICIDRDQVANYDPATSSSTNERRTYKPIEFATVQEYHSHVLKTIYRPNAFVKNYLKKNQLLAQLRLHATKYIGLHIRFSDKVAGPVAETQRIDIEEYLHACLRVRELHGVNTIILCSDTIDAISQLNALNEKNAYMFDIMWNKDEPRCDDNLKHSVVYRGNTGQLSDKQLELEYLTCFVNMDILMHSEVIVGNFDSCFALVAVELRNNPHDINVVGRTPRWGIESGGGW